MGSACSACESSDNIVSEKSQEIKDQVFRDADDEINGYEGMKKSRTDEDIAVFLGPGVSYNGSTKSPRPPMDGERMPILLGSTSPRDDSCKTSYGSAQVCVVHQLGVISEDQQQASGVSLRATARRPHDEPLEESSSRARKMSGGQRGTSRQRTVSSTRTDPVTNGSNSTAIGTPCPQRWPSVTSIHSAVSGQEPQRLLALRFPVSSYAVCDEPAKLPSRHIAWSPSPTHSVHQSEYSVTAYGEIYGDHPMSFEFDAVGSKIPRPDFDQQRKMGVNARHCIETVRGLKQGGLKKRR